jgi:glycosyltransferase involved in cell wall biosynthesis
MPSIANDLKLNKNGSGGWMVALLAQLQKQQDIEIAVASVSKKVKQLYKKKIEGVYYYVLPNTKGNAKYNDEFEKHWVKIKSEFNPDVVHIHGTEFSHGLAYIKACSSENVVISIQGLISIIERYYLAGIEKKEILRSTTISDFLLNKGILSNQRKYKKRSVLEIEYIKSVQHIIGRTDWDKCHVLSLKPKVQYHHCDEILRDSFYHKKWDVKTCEKYSIFVSQCSYPLKGFHQLLKAMPFILSEFPQAKIYVGGSAEIYPKSIKRKILDNGYYVYLRKLIDKFCLSDRIHFIGGLSEEEMCAQYLNSHVFVLPSSIENSSNSLGEAQLLGVPSVASYVGGNPQFMGNGVAGKLYRFEEVEMLAEAVCRIFRGESSIEQETEIGRKLARERHDSKTNAERIFQIYQQIKAEYILNE